MKHFVNVAMRMEEAFYNISMYLYNKNVLEYAQIARSGPKSMIRNIEGSSKKYISTCISGKLKQKLDISAKLCLLRK